MEIDLSKNSKKNKLQTSSSQKFLTKEELKTLNPKTFLLRYITDKSITEGNEKKLNVFDILNGAVDINELTRNQKIEGTNPFLQTGDYYVLKEKLFSGKGVEIFFGGLGDRDRYAPDSFYRVDDELSLKCHNSNVVLSFEYYEHPDLKTIILESSLYKENEKEILAGSVKMIDLFRKQIGVFRCFSKGSIFCGGVLLKILNKIQSYEKLEKDNNDLFLLNIDGIPRTLFRIPWERDILHPSYKKAIEQIVEEKKNIFINFSLTGGDILHTDVTVENLKEEYGVSLEELNKHNNAVMENNLKFLIDSTEDMKALKFLSNGLSSINNCSKEENQVLGKLKSLNKTLSQFIEIIEKKENSQESIRVANIIKSFCDQKIIDCFLLQYLVKDEDLRRKYDLLDIKNLEKKEPFFGFFKKIKNSLKKLLNREVSQTRVYDKGSHLLNNDLIGNINSSVNTKIEKAKKQEIEKLPNDLKEYDVKSLGISGDGSPDYIVIFESSENNSPDRSLEEINSQSSIKLE